MSQAITNSVSYPRGTGKTKNFILWMTQIAVALMLLRAGFFKLLGAEEMVGLFDAIGLGQWLRHVTGGTEVLGALLLLTPEFAGLGALILIGVMLGAVATHLFVIGGNAAFAVVFLVAVGIIARGRWQATSRLIGASHEGEPKL